MTSDNSKPSQALENVKAAAPITVHLDGDLQAVPFISDLKRAGLRLVEENGQTWLRRASEPVEVEPETITDTLEAAKEALSRSEIVDALQFIGCAERIIKRQASWLRYALIHTDDADAITTLAAHALHEGDDCVPEARHALNENVWPAIHKAERAIGFALRAIDPAAVQNMRLEVAWDEEEREMIDRTEAMND